MRKTILVITVFAVVAHANEIYGWGTDYFLSYPQPNEGFIQVATGFSSTHSLAIRDDNTVVAWGNNNYGQCNVPPGIHASQVAVGEWFSAALLLDGSVIVWGIDNDTFPMVSGAPTGGNFTQISAGNGHCVALNVHTQTVVAWGDTTYGQCEVPPITIGQVVAGNNVTAYRSTYGEITMRGQAGTWGMLTPPSGCFVDVALGWNHGLARNQNGYISTWGSNDEGQRNIPSGQTFTDMAAGHKTSIAIRPDGTVEAWGYDYYGVVSECPWWGGFSGVVAGKQHALALQSNVSVWHGETEDIGQLSLVVSPNPSKGLVVVSFSGGGNVEVYDISGRAVASVSVPESGLTAWSAPSAGVYFAVSEGSEAPATRFVVLD